MLGQNEERTAGLDVIGLLAKRLEALPSGDHSIGLKAVLSHVGVAAAHLDRGRRTGDDSAFTDAIYRTNQAFEGSLKEAYRVVASKDPEHTTSFEIESYLQKSQVLRPRVLTQFTRYRKEWRNPSTHDYRLDFDEDEALLAIVSVCALAIVLSDQVAQTLGFQAAKADGPPSLDSVTSQPLTSQLVDALLKFDGSWLVRHSEFSRESAVVGALHGYLEAALPDAEVLADVPVGQGSHVARLDLLVRSGDSRVIIEVKNLRGRRLVGDPIAQLAGYLMLTGLHDAVLYVPTDGLDLPMCYEQDLVTGGKVSIVGPPSLRTS